MDFAAEDYLCDTPPPRYTLYTYIYLFTQGRGGGGRV